MTFVDGRGQITAPRIPAEVWESHKDVILSKYGKMTLKEVMAFMETEHGFKATQAIPPKQPAEAPPADI